MATSGESNTSHPFVSVVVPVLHDGPGIRTCLEALLSQTYPPDRYEIVVADNGSTDDTRGVVERLRAGRGSRLSLVVEGQVRTSYAARNRGIRVARGEILAFTDADCVPAPTWLECGVRALRTEAAAVAGGRIVVTYRGPRPNAYEYWDSAVHFNQARYIEHHHFAATANLFLRADVLERCESFRSDLVSGGDYEFGVRLWKAGERLVYAPDAVVAHPARATLGALCRKGLRVARAQWRQHQLGLGPRWGCVRKLGRSWKCPVPRDWAGRAPVSVTLGARLLHHLNAWLFLTVCAAHGVRAWARSWRLGPWGRRPDQPRRKSFAPKPEWPAGAGSPDGTV